MAVKNDVLAVLENNRGKAVSGAWLAENLGVSRNAVWKAINSLRDDGYIIGSQGKKGYLLSEQSNVISAQRIRSFLPESLDDVKILTYKEASSTNDEAKKFCLLSPQERAVFIADRQTAGRGRFGRSFYSPPETGLYLSAITHPNMSIKRSAVYTAASAVATLRAIQKETGVKPQIKWINDLYIGKKKVCGILTEAVTDFETGQVRSMISGIGVNVTTEDFPEQISGKAASIGRFADRSRLAALIIAELYKLHLSSPEEFMEEYRRNCFLIGKEVGFYDGNERFRGTVADITDSCELVLVRDGKRCVFSHGEITDF